MLALKNIVCVIILQSIVLTHQHQDTPFDHNDASHIKKDIKEHYYVDIDEKTNEQELEFLNFQHYDYDQNLMLDGLEILMELNHNAEHVSEQLNRMSSVERQTYWNDKYHKDAVIVDTVMKEYDTNDDGYISFAEYMTLKAKLRHN